MNIRNYLSAVALCTSLVLPAQTAKYVFYYIGDGMGLGTIQATRNYSRHLLGSDSTLNMMQMPVAGWVQTYSANNDVTDSAASGTALSTGHKTKNSMLGMTADSTAVPSIAKLLFDKGWGVAVATTVAPDDATPAAFYAHVPKRHDFYEIGCQLAETGYQFVAGGALRGLTVDDKPTDLLDRFEANNVQIVYGPDEIEKINSEKVLLLNVKNFPKSDVGYAIDSVPGILTLPVIARAALAQMEKTSPQHFFMMIEGGNIDHALHGNDGGTAIMETINFDQALTPALEFYRRHPEETLIVVTADHDTGGLSVVKPSGAKGSIGNLVYQKVSKEEFSNFCKAMLKTRNIFTWNDMKQYLAENLGFFTKIKISEKAEKKLKKLFDDTFRLRNTNDQETLYANFNAFAVEVFSMFNQASGLSYSTTSHSGSPVPLFAIGAGAENFKGLIDNTDIPKLILKAVGEK